MVRATLHQSAQVKIKSVQKRRDGDSQQVLSTQILPHGPCVELCCNLFKIPIWLLCCRRQRFWSDTFLIACASRKPSQVLGDQLSALVSCKCDAIGQQVIVGFKIKKPRDRNQLILMTVSNGQAVAIGMGTRKRHEILFAKLPRQSVSDGFDHVRKSNAAF